MYKGTAAGSKWTRIARGSAIAKSPAHPEVRACCDLPSTAPQLTLGKLLQVAFVQGIDAGDHHEQTSRVTVDGGQTFHKITTPYSIVGVKFHPRMAK